MVSFSPNGTAAAANTTATFTGAGPYTITLVVTDPLGQSGTASKSVAVSQTASSISVSPNPAWSPLGGSQTFTADEQDQFGSDMANQPTFNWTAINGTITSAGLYTAPSTAQSDTVTATDAAILGISGTSNVTVSSQVPMSAVTITINTAQPVIGATASLTGSATGTGTLTYSWSDDTGTVSFSDSGDATAANTTATFPSAGTYNITLTVTDMTGATASTSTSVTVNETATNITVTPNPAYVAPSGTQLFSAVENDQFGIAMPMPPTFNWAITDLTN
jgi:hypothetical protein